MTRQDLRQRGHAVRKDLGIAAPTQPDVLPGFDDLMAEIAYGGIWDRPHLSKHDRMICTLAVCSPYLRPQLATLIGSALDIGLTPLAMLEVFLQAGLYGGFVTTEAASEVAREVFAARGVSVPLSRRGMRAMRSSTPPAMPSWLSCMASAPRVAMRHRATRSPARSIPPPSGMAMASCGVAPA